jgi:ribosomal protein S12 methylthiotransferase accessory factor
MNAIEVSFPGGKRVDAHVGGFVVHTAQPVAAGGDGSAPSPFDLFLASLATCTGITVHAFCQARGLTTDGVRITQVVEHDPATKLVNRIRHELVLPDSFPEKYRAGVVHAAESCKVKRTILAALTMEVSLASAEPFAQSA